MGCVSSSGVSQPAESSCSHRPVNIVAWVGRLHDEGARAESNRIPRSASSTRVKLVCAVVAVQAQMVRRDGVQHDQQNIRRPGGGSGRAAARVLDPIANPYRRSHDITNTTAAGN